MLSGWTVSGCFSPGICVAFYKSSLSFQLLSQLFNLKTNTSVSSFLVQMRNVAIVNTCHCSDLLIN